MPGKLAFLRPFAKIYSHMQDYGETAPTSNTESPSAAAGQSPASRAADHQKKRGSIGGRHRAHIRKRYPSDSIHPYIP
ncbi:hypothetical protein PG996_015766 [Apiospora saccharicola]|uniref:Uncharacterized protein n=1 Tax=Apiospora saccharicola TaxID=335842 RepID=A0ABR1TM67_9PEZI